MSGSVTVLWQGRRHAITTNPNTKLTQILEQACAKCGLGANGHTLKYQNKAVNLSLSLRMANIPNNAKFDLAPTDDVRKAKDVTLVVQLPDGQRLQHMCAATTPLWLVLTALDTRTELAGGSVTRRCTEKDGLSIYEQPLCVILNTQHGGDLESLATTTLEATGITEGSAIVRLLFRPTDIVWEEAETRLARLDQSAQAFVDNAASTTQRLAEERQAQARAPQPTARPQSMGAAADTEMMDVEQNVTAPAQQQPTPAHAPPRQASHTPQPGFTNFQPFAQESTFMRGGGAEPMDWEGGRPPSQPQPPQRGPPTTMGEMLGMSLEPEPIRPEDAMPFKDFKFPDKKIEKPAGKGGATAVEDVRVMMKHMAEGKQSADEKPLMTARLREGFAEKLYNYKTTVLRIQFPDRRVLQGTFEPKEPLSNVFEFVRSHVDPSVSRGFVLYTTPPRRELSDSKATSLMQAGLVPAAVVHFKPPADAPTTCLSADSIATHGTTYQAAQSTATWKTSQPPSNQSPASTASQQPPRGPGGGMGGTGARGGGAQGGGAPKWMKLGK